MSKFRNHWFVYVLAAGLVLVAAPEEKKKPSPPPTKTDVALTVEVSAQRIPQQLKQRLRRSPYDARRLVCKASGKISDDARVAGACHNYPHLAFRGSGISFS